MKILLLNILAPIGLGVVLFFLGTGPFLAAISTAVGWCMGRINYKIFEKESIADMAAVADYCRERTVQLELENRRLRKENLALMKTANHQVRPAPTLDMEDCRGCWEAQLTKKPTVH